MLVFCCKCVFDMCVFIGSSPHLFVCVNLCWGHPTIVVWLSVRLCVCVFVCLFCFHWVLPMFHIGPSQHVVYCLLLYVAMGPLPHVMSFCVLFLCLFMGSSPHVFYSRGPIHAVVWGHPHFFHGVLSSETLLLGLASSPGK